MADTKKTVDELRNRKGGEMGFGEIFSDPRLNQAGENLAGNIGYGDAMTMMALGRSRDVPYGGKLSPWQAAADGLKQGIGMYNFIKTQKDKQQAMAEQLRRYKEMYPTTEGEQLYTEDGTPMRPDGSMGFTFNQG